VASLLILLHRQVWCDNGGQTGGPVCPLAGLHHASIACVIRGKVCEMDLMILAMCNNVCVSDVKRHVRQSPVISALS
jgi:hypothetical protein